MAGIGFELKRVLSQGGNLSRTIRAVASGVFIVAGPWFLSVLTIYAVGWWYSAAVGDGTPLLFQSIVTYTYAVSLVLFSAIQYFFVRLLSDLVWNDRTGEAAWFLGVFFLGVVAVSGIISWLLIGFLGPEIDPAVRGVWALFSASVNGLWVVMLFISVLKWFGRILFVYLAGVAAGVSLAFWLVPAAGLAGALGCLASANALIAGGLLLLSFQAYPARRPTGVIALVRRTAVENGWLVGGGILFTLGLWVDKFFYWIWFGSAAAGSFLRAYPPYDMVVYLAGLTMVPGLVFFIIVTETRFATSVTQFLQALASQPYWQIRRRQFALARVVGSEWVGLAGFQALVAGAVLGAQSALTGSLDLRLAVGLAGALAQLLLMVGVTFFFYLELYREAALVSAVFLVSGILGCLLQTVFPDWYPGVGFGLSATLAAGLGMTLLRFRIRSIDRILFNHW